ncbi:ORF30 [Retroperitoneal fibromatosis-associated herpesvirus]|uniref:ORF30 n=1 Tax=Retroperitoneal fibromatosis-associated herpesvirus TaxID=111469 RepID=U5NM51_9GAMA|nr:ORF30 [Retroperitoneal fibromatosis-associated herpesvirus]AGY30713.1 ORF30 [Retroperitoneal fibromatosis-associated herpesvirus]
MQDHPRCDMRLLDSPLCRLHNVFSLYQCVICREYHVCDGGSACVLVNTPENVICDLTGNCVADNLQETQRSGPSRIRGADMPPDTAAYHAVLACLKRDIVSNLRSWTDTWDVAEQIALEDGVSDVISGIIDDTFFDCLPVLAEARGGYALLCSMYLHVIVSIYSTKTVYNSMLFKCTKNKKYDCIAKRVRARWMHMLSTRGI